MTLLSVFSQVMRRRPFGLQQSPMIFKAYVTNAPNPVIGTNDLENPTTEGTSDQAQKITEEARGMASTAAAKIDEAAHEIGEEVKEVADEAKSRATGVAEQTAKCVRENAEKVERAMNTKN